MGDFNMLKAVFFCIALYFGICFSQNDNTASIFIGANNLEGIGLPTSEGENLHPCTPDDFVVEYPLPGELVGASGALFSNGEYMMMVCGGWSYGLAAVQDKCFVWAGDEWFTMPGL